MVGHAVDDDIDLAVVDSLLSLEEAISKVSIPNHYIQGVVVLV